MDAEFYKDIDGYCSAPLPWKRALYLNTSLKKDHHKRQHFFALMSKVIASRAAEVVPSDISGEFWYLPLFGVCNSKNR